jgi:hypothetical protein
MYRILKAFRSFIKNGQKAELPYKMDFRDGLRTEGHTSQRLSEIAIQKEDHMRTANKILLRSPVK